MERKSLSMRLHQAHSFPPFFSVEFFSGDGCSGKGVRCHCGHFSVCATLQHGAETRPQLQDCDRHQQGPERWIRHVGGMVPERQRRFSKIAVPWPRPLRSYRRPCPARICFSIGGPCPTRPCPTAIQFWGYLCILAGSVKACGVCA